ncbi:MAG: calcium-binding protein [Pseudomonadota bacterium]
MTDYVGTDGADTIIADRGAGKIQGLGGNDRLVVHSFGHYTIDGGDGNDSIFGGSFTDVLNGGAGDDYIDCDSSDTILGGAGADVFNWGGGRAGTSLSGRTNIADWDSSDRISFASGSFDSPLYMETTAADATAAGEAAKAFMSASSGYKIMVVAVGSDLYVFAGPRTSYNDVVRIVGRNLDDVSLANFVTTAQAPTYGGTVGNDVIVGDGAPGTLQGLAGDDTLIVNASGNFTLQGDGGDDRLFGGNGADSLSGGAGRDFIEGGLAQDTLAGGADADVFNWAGGQAGLNATDSIVDWSPEDRLSFGNGGVIGGGYEEATAASLDAARIVANQAIGAGRANFVAVAVGSDVYVFADGLNNDGSADDMVALRGRTLADIDAANFAATAAGPVLPPPPVAATGGARVEVNGDMDLIQPGELVGAFVTDATDVNLQIQGPRASVTVGGIGFTYADGQLVGGSGRALVYVVNSATENLLTFNVIDADFPAAALGGWVATNDAQGALSTILAGADRINGHAPTTLFPDDGADLIRGYGGDDQIRGYGGPDSLFGGAGNDQIYAHGIGNTPKVAATYLRGEEGDDYIVGSVGFDDINGNQGADTGAGGAGDDWVVGGKDNDLLFGESGRDLVYGNLGDDTCQGGDGNDIVRGGQNNDLVFGDAGDDYVSGDKGDDTVSGGAGADLFHTFGDAGIDRVVDFDTGQGDRVLLDPGTQHTVAQVGADTVISMTGGGQMILVGVQLSSLPDGWIFGA